MSAPSVRPPSRISRARYGAVGVLCLVFGTLRLVAGDEPSLSVLKALLVPVACLSVVALEAIHPFPTLEARWTIRTVERAALYAWLAAGFVTVSQWTPGEPLSVTLGWYAIVFGVTALALLTGHWLYIRRLRRGVTPSA